MEKQLSIVGYWLGLISTILAVIFRILSAVNVYVPPINTPSGTAIATPGFLHAAVLFFVLSIASWCRIPKS
jgi:hypothetical protein